MISRSYIASLASWFLDCTTLNFLSVVLTKSESYQEGYWPAGHLGVLTRWKEDHLSPSSSTWFFLACYIAQVACTGTLGHTGTFRVLVLFGSDTVF